MATTGTKERAPKGMAKGIVAKAMTAHPTWNAKQISENYPVGQSTAHKYMKLIRDQSEWMADLTENLLTPEETQEMLAGSYETTRQYKESDLRIGVVSGFALGVVLTITAAAFMGAI